MKNPENFRIAWLLPTAWFYWQPSLSEFTKLFPQTKVFTGLWPGFAKGFEDTLNVEVVGDRKIIPINTNTKGYGVGFTYLSPKIINRLLDFKPNIIFTSSFGLWTVLALLLKPLGWWKVIIAYEGSAPGVDYRNSPTRLALRQAMVKLADACITNSNSGKNYLVEVLKAKEKRVFAHPYEVPDATSLLKEEETIQRDFSQLTHPIFLFVGSIIPRKGLETLLKACAILQSQEIQNYKLLIIGDGPQEEELKTFTQEHHLDQCVDWVGRVNYTQVGDYFRYSDVFVLPTLEDTWGVVVLEALIFGKAVLCSKAAGAAELVRDGDNGYCFEPNDPKALAEIMARFIKNPKLSHLMGDKSRQLMEQYTPKDAANFLKQVTNFV